MDNRLTVQVAKSFARLGNGPSECGVDLRGEQTDLHRNARDLVFLQGVVFDYVGQGATLHIFHYNPKFIVLDQVRIEKVHDVGVLRFLHNQDLVDDKFLARLVGEIHLLDGDLLSCGQSLGDINMSGSTTDQSKRECRANN